MIEDDDQPILLSDEALGSDRPAPRPVDRSVDENDLPPHHRAGWSTAIPVDAAPPPQEVVEQQSAPVEDAEQGADGADPQPQQPDPVPDDSDANGGALAAVREELAALRAETVHLNGILDRLHAENERLRRGETEQMMLPLLRDLIKMADDWRAMATSWSARESATPQDVARKCSDVADDAGLILGRYGIEEIQPAAGDELQRKLHRAVTFVPVGDPVLDGTVASVRRAGYLYGEKVLRFADVVGQRYESGTSDPEVTAQEAGSGTS